VLPCSLQEIWKSLVIIPAYKTIVKIPLKCLHVFTLNF
jgi:hypothetical protein